MKLAPAQGLRKGLPWPAPVAIAAFAFVVRWVDIPQYGLDGDELFSIHAADSTWGHLFWTAIADRSHPPLFYSLLKFWINFGPIAENWVRLLPVLCGVAAVLVSYAICNELQLGNRDKLLVLFLGSMNGLLIFYSDYTRMFALLDFSSILSIFMLIKVLRHSDSKFYWILFTFVNVVLVYSHYWGWFLIFAETFLILFSEIRKTFLISTLVVSAAFLPWAVAIAIDALNAGTLMQQIRWMGQTTPGVGGYAWLFGQFDGIIDFRHATSIGIVLFAAPIASSAVWSARYGTRSACDPQSPQFWVALLIIPLLLTSAASYVTRQNLWAESHLSLVALPYFVFIGFSIGALPSRVLRTGFRCALLAWAAVASATYLGSSNKMLHWERLAKAMVLQARAPIYAAEPFIVRPLAYHVSRAAHEQTRVREGAVLQKIPQRRFWFVYRNTIWKGATPEDQLRALGDEVAASLAITSGSQTVIALLVQRQ